LSLVYIGYCRTGPEGCAPNYVHFRPDLSVLHGFDMMGIPAFVDTLRT
jgi:hypothetical protein